MNRQAEYGYEKTRPHDDSLADQVADTAKDYAKKARGVGEDAIEVADGYLRPIGLSLREKPMTTLAVFGGIAFVAGAAFWMLRHSRAAISPGRFAGPAARPLPWFALVVVEREPKATRSFPHRTKKKNFGFDELSDWLREEARHLVRANPSIDGLEVVSIDLTKKVRKTSWVGDEDDNAGRLIT